MEKIENKELHEILDTSFTSYALMVLEDRALPDARDGLKPSQRRILYTMGQLGLNSRGSTEKSAKICGSCSGDYHPHGEQVIYPTMVRLVQPWVSNLPLCIGQGNFGSPDGDSPAAMRYSEAKLSPFGELLLEDLSIETVEHIKNYNEKLLEPTVLPAKFNNLLVNGCSGIAVGWATNMPSHNLAEVCNATIEWIKDNNITVEKIMEKIPGPDFSTGGKILGTEGILDYYKTGKGSVKLEAVWSSRTSIKGIEFITVTELPYGASPEKLCIQIENLVKEDKLSGISDLKNLSSQKTGIQVVIEIAKGHNSKIVLNNLLKKTCLRENFSINQTVLIDGKVYPDVGILKLIETFVNHRVDVLTKKFNAELISIKNRVHILDGLISVSSKIDQTIKIVRSSESSEEAIKKLLSEKIVSTEIQAKAVLAITLSQLTKLENSKLLDEKKKKEERISYLNKILKDKKEINKIIIEEQEEIIKKYGSERKTKILKSTKDIADEDLIKDENLVITLTGDGYIKSMPVTTFKMQSRGVKGVNGVEETDIFELFECNSKDYILFFTNKGLVYRRKAWEIPVSTNKTSKGEHVSGLLSFDVDEVITNMIGITSKDNSGYLTIVTKKGCIKKTEIAEFDTLRNTGLTAIKLEESDAVAFTLHTTGKDDLLLITEQGSCVRYNENLVPVQGRATKGSRAMKLDDGDSIVKIMNVENDSNSDLILMTRLGWMKKSSIKEYKSYNNRAVKGIYAIKTDAIKKHGIIVGACLVNKDDSLLVMTEKGKIARISTEDIKNTARNTSGIRGVTLENEDSISNITKIKG